MFGQSRRCTVTPRARVTKPTIGSGGTGLQHLAIRVAMLLTPSTSTPEEVFVGRRRHERCGRRLGHRRLAAHGDVDLAVGHLAAPERRVEIIELGEARGVRDLLVRFARGAQPLQLLVERCAPCGHVLVEILVAEPLAHLGERARAGEVAQLRRQPVARRPALLGRSDLDALRVLQLVVERHHLAVDLGAAAAVAQVRVHVVGEVDRRGARGQVHDAPLRA